MKYLLTIVPSARKELLNLPDILIKRIDRVITNLSETPRPHGCIKLTGVEAYRIRLGNYRIIYEISDSLRQVRILAIGHRREIYR